VSAALPPSSQPDTLLAVQYLRAAAAVAVVFYHISVLSQKTWGLDPERIDHVAAAGVDLFFVISGFIMAMIVARSAGFNGKDFWIRRVARVVPAYWVITFVVFALALKMPQLFNSTTADLYSLFASLSFLALEQGDGSTTPLLVVGWTLNYEIFFYAIVALTAGLFGDRKLMGTSAALICLVAAGVLFGPDSGALAFYSDPILLEFVFGILIFQSWSQSRGRDRGRGPGLVPIAVFTAGLLLLALQWERPVGEWRALFWGVPAAAVLYGGLSVLTFRSAVLARLGEWSYALYLTHVFVVTFYIKHAISTVTTIALPWQLHYLIITGVAVLAAAAYHYAVEAPLSRWSLRMLRGSGPVAGVDLPLTANRSR